MSRIVKGIALALVFVLAGIGTFWGLGQVLHFETGLPSFFSSGQPFYHGENYRGFLINTRENEDFPSAPGLEAKDLRAEIDQIVAFAKNGGYNTLFLEVRPDGSVIYRSQYFPTSEVVVTARGDYAKFDPLKYFAEAASQNELELWAVVNSYFVMDSGDVSFALANIDNAPSVIEVGGQLYFDPASPLTAELVANSCGELMEKYPIAGVVIEGLDAPVKGADATAAENLLAAVHQRIAVVREDGQLGVVIGVIPETLGADLPIGPADLAAMAEGDTIQLVVPRMNTMVGWEEQDYADVLDVWAKAAGESVRQKYVTCNEAWRIDENMNNTGGTGPFHFLDQDELVYQLYVNSLRTDVNGMVLDSYGDLLRSGIHTSVLPGLVPQPEAPHLVALPHLEALIPQQLKLQMPDGGSRNETGWSWNTSGSTYFISGTSDPKLPLTLNDKEVERLTKDGVFGTLVKLAEGANTFTLRQGENVQTAVITRTIPRTTPSPIDTILADTIFPTTDEPVWFGDHLRIRCTAPSGATITAEINGQKVGLKQTSQVAAGLPATFEGSISLSGNFPAGFVTKVGNVQYTLSYGGVNTNFKSAGSVFYAGQGARFAVEVTAWFTGVFPDNQEEDIFLSNIKQGARDYIVDKTSTRFELPDGTFVKRADVKIMEGQVDLHNMVTQIIWDTSEQAEVFTLVGTNTPAFGVVMNEKGLNVRLSNTTLAESADLTILNSSYISGVTAQEEDGYATLSIGLTENNRLWGYSIEYSGNNTIIYCRKPPKLSPNPQRPLEGIRIMLDPGHGGSDSGALGAAGGIGPTEAQINYGVAGAVKSWLEQLGATVEMTVSAEAMADSENKVTLQERSAMPQTMKPDFFISIHHNSGPVQNDGGEMTGTQVYYREDMSAPFANQLMEQLGSKLLRRTFSPFQDYYYVTRITYAPAVMLELGFLPNPVDYETLCDDMMILKTAVGISNSIISTIQTADAPAALPEEPTSESMPASENISGQAA